MFLPPRYDGGTARRRAVCAALLLPVLGQETPPSAGQEVAVNLATGRVLITVVKDAILIATVENPIEAGTRPPAPVELDSSRVGIILGPVDWFSPSSQLQIANLDKELPHLKARTAAAPAPLRIWGRRRAAIKRRISKPPGKDLESGSTWWPRDYGPE